MKKLRYLLIVLFAFLVVSCSSGVNNKGDIADGNYPNQGEIGNLGDNNIVIPEGHKIIYVVEYQMKIKDDIQPVVSSINTKLYTLNGYISYSSDSITYATYEYKVPTENLNAFLDAIDETGGVSSKKITSEDVTSAYNELEAEIEVLEASRAAYVKMLEEDGLSLNEVITLNDKIQAIDVSLKSLYKKIDSYNKRIDYATVTINYRLNDVYVKPGFLDGYGEFLLNIGKAIVEFVAYTIPFAAIAGGGILIVYSIKKRKKNKK